MREGKIHILLQGGIGRAGAGAGGTVNCGNESCFCLGSRNVSNLLGLNLR